MQPWTAGRVRPPKRANRRLVIECRTNALCPNTVMEFYKVHEELKVRELRSAETLRELLSNK